jgi:hypothetical protein
MNVYKYRDLENYERFHQPSLINNQIYAPLFEELNDPFEGLYDEQISNIVKLLERIFGANGGEVISNFKKIIKYKENLGIFSLSKVYDEELMWAHYASSHKGFCIEYDVDKLKDKYLAPQTLHQFDVHYRKRPQKITTNDIGKNKLLTKLFATKSLKWKHEKEVRLLFDSSSLKNYHPSALTGIYFGSKMSDYIKQKLIDLLANKDVKFYETYREAKSYILKRRLIHENYRRSSKNVPTTYEILKTNHFPALQNFDVLYKGTEFDEKSIKTFVDNFIDEFAIKDCNVFLFKKINGNNIEFASYDTKTPGYIYWNDLKKNN